VSLGALHALIPQGGNQVIIGVLYAKPSPPRMGPKGEKLAEWSITDLDKHGPQQGKLMFVNRAMEHWACQDGPGRAHATVGSIFGILNPYPAGQTRCIRVSLETQVLKLGTCPSLGFCPCKLADGLECRKPYDKDQGVGLCSTHANMSPCSRQASVSKKNCPSRVWT